MRVQAIQQMQKSLDQMNIRVHHALSDIDGKTGTAIIKAIVEGERNPARLAKLRNVRCKKSEKVDVPWLSVQHRLIQVNVCRHTHCVALVRSNLTICLTKQPPTTVRTDIASFKIRLYFSPSEPSKFK
jgi:hypothetical protein